MIQKQLSFLHPKVFGHGGVLTLTFQHETTIPSWKHTFSNRSHELMDRPLLSKNPADF